jgi:hypothetical protein
MSHIAAAGSREQRNYVWLVRDWLTENGAEDDAEFMQEALVQAAKNGAKETVELLFTLGIVRPR